MPHFIEEDPSLEDYWRAIILFGRNVASYKFALGQSLIGLAAQGREFVTLEELADPFAEHICNHLKDFDKQGTSGRSRFLHACREFNEEKLGLDGLRDATVRLGFNNVIDAFHVVGSGAVGQRFYEDERKSPQRGIRIREELCELVGSEQGGSLPVEVEARWRLVETAWSLEVPLRTVEVSYDKEDELLFVEDANRRRNITGCRDALSGYQKGKCFFCGGGISVVAGSSNLGEVEHLIPHTLAEHLPWTNLDGVWNLTLGCVDCNRGKGGKSARIPALRFLERLHERNEYYIASHHPLRETILNQTGARESLRMQFLNRVWNAANRLLGGSVPWEPA